MLLSLSTGHTIGLLLVAGAFIVFALVCSLVIPRRRPDFPGIHMGWFIAVSLVFFVAALVAVNFFGVEAKEAEAKAETSTSTTTQPAATGATTTTAAPAGDATKGKALYTSLGCVGCHSLDGSKGTGPTFKGLAGSKVQLDERPERDGRRGVPDEVDRRPRRGDRPGLHARDHERRDQARLRLAGGHG